MNLSNRNHASARGGQRANTGPFKIDTGAVNGATMVAVLQMRRLMRENNASADEVIRAARATGHIDCAESDLAALKELLTANP